MSKLKLVPPCSYQGGKQRLAKSIVDVIIEQNIIDENTKFYDLCSGSGAVSLELINRGVIHPSNITMVDNGCFGEVWNAIAKNEFDLDLFKQEIDKLPDKEGIKDYLFNMSKSTIDTDLTIYHYLLLQSGSFGSKAIWRNDSQWCTSSFRNYWLPTTTSSRRSPVNPMMPMPDTMYDRMVSIIESIGGVINAIHGDVFNVLDNIKSFNTIIYVDPPYKNTAGYKSDFNINDVVNRLGNKSPLYVSEGYQMDGYSDIILLSKGRSKGNMNGVAKKKPVEEWLNVFK